MGGIEIDFNGVKPSAEIRNKMKAGKYRWNPAKMVWCAYKNDETIAVAKEICGEGLVASAVNDEVLEPASKKYVR